MKAYWMWDSGIFGKLFASVMHQFYTPSAQGMIWKEEIVKTLHFHQLKLQNSLYPLPHISRATLHYRPLSWHMWRRLIFSIKYRKYVPGIIEPLDLFFGRWYIKSYEETLAPLFYFYLSLPVCCQSRGLCSLLQTDPPRLSAFLQQPDYFLSFDKWLLSLKRMKKQKNKTHQRRLWLWPFAVQTARFLILPSNSGFITINGLVCHVEFSTQTST